MAGLRNDTIIIMFRKMGIRGSNLIGFSFGKLLIACINREQPLGGSNVSRNPSSFLQITHTSDCF